MGKMCAEKYCAGILETIQEFAQEDPREIVRRKKDEKLVRQIGLWDWVQNFREIFSALTMKYGFDNFGNGHGNQGGLEIGFSQNH